MSVGLLEKLQGLSMILVGIFVVGLFAGFVDAIAGGGGLIMLPGLLFTGLPVGSAIATNKLCGTSGALTSTLKFAHAKQIDWRACGLMGIPAVVGAYLGSRSMGKLPNTWAEPIVIALMVAITLFVLIKPSFGLSPADDSHTTPKTLSLKAGLIGVSAGFCIGFHDGFFGPGTGVFLVFALLSLWSLDFLKGTGTTKVINLMTNCTALVTFAALGNIDYGKGIAGAIGLGIGSFVGATFATKKGARLIKPIFIAVTIALIAKLLFDYVSNQ
ncbi:MAG: TSUP family transporter [Cyanobacteria bacterium J06632_3]